MSHLYDFLKHCFGNVDEKKCVGVVGRHTDELVAVVVRGQEVHTWVSQLEENASVGASPSNIARYHNVVPETIHTIKPSKGSRQHLKKLLKQTFEIFREQ